MNFWKFQQTHTFFSPAFFVTLFQKKIEKRSVHVLGAFPLTINYIYQKQLERSFARLAYIVVNIKREPNWVDMTEMTWL